MMATLAIGSLTAAGQAVVADRTADGYLNISIWGTFSGSIAIQRSFDRGATWLTIDIFTVPAEDYGFEPEECLYRFFSTEFSTGTAHVRLGGEDREFH